MTEPNRSLPPAPSFDGASDPSLTGRFLSNGRFTSRINALGAGDATCGGTALTRFDEDALRHDHGFFFYLRDRETGGFHLLTRRGADDPGAVTGAWAPGAVRFTREGADLYAAMEVGVPPDDDVELRVVVVTNRSDRPRLLEITTCAEVVLAARDADRAHPAFSKLFVQTERDEASGVLVAARRPRAPGETHPLLYHALVGAGELEWETDRFRFVGRGGSFASPAALRSDAALAGSVGAVLDPVVVLRRVFRLDPGGTARFVALLGAAPAREAALRSVARWSRGAEAEAGLDAARRRGAETTAAAGLAAGEAAYLESLASAALRSHPAIRRTPRPIPVDPAGLRVYETAGVRGDRPYVYVPEAGANGDDRVRRAARYWASIGADLPWIAGRGAGIRGAVEIDLDSLPPGEREALAAGAALVWSGDPPALRGPGFEEDDGGRALRPAEGTTRPGPPARRTKALRFDNGFGGFSDDGSEYVIRLERDRSGGLRLPPLPWVNVIANDRIGFLVSETGAGCTWGRNSREYRLTPWSNDPLIDPHDEALYLRDDESGAFRSPLPGPAPAPGEYEARHGFGYSLFRHEGDGLALSTCLFVAADDPVKITRVRITNQGDRPRRLSLFSYRRLVLGVDAESTNRFVTTEIDAPSGALLARNGRDEGGAVAFAVPVPPREGCPVTLSGDRRGFLGTGGDAARPAALVRSEPAASATGAALDPAFVERVGFEVAPGESIECSFLFGAASNDDEARSIVNRYRARGAVEEAMAEVMAGWRRIRAGLRIATPRPALDLMFNGWLPYQTIACRLRGRTAFYQSGGAFGFRDQLQDAASLIYVAPERTREQILLHAAHQFVEGDVLHWWHPPKSRGIRTRFADDRLWLPYIAAFYVRTTGDEGVLAEPAPFLEARPLEPGEDEAFVEPRESGATADVYEHCCRAIDVSLATGAHDLPLFGTGDWNDGMNRVGREGRGESVWMAFFLIRVLDGFLPLVRARGDAARAARYAEAKERLVAAANDGGWDGGWYRRGYYDDGTPLGSSGSDECRIDALAQAWSVISGAAPRERAERALDAAAQELIAENEGIIRLLAPPFDKTPHDPGYIKGYVPGVRENGGQYTHAALWVVRALAELGRNDRAARLLEMLTPVAHGGSAEAIGTYRVEPYVVAADVYGEPPHVGRGGWTWYTGSSAWMYRVLLESVLGIRVEGGNSLRIRPRVPDDWPRYDVTWRVPGNGAVYEIAVENPRRRARAVIEATLDGSPIAVKDGAVLVPVRRDGGRHRVLVTVG